MTTEQFNVAIVTQTLGLLNSKLKDDDRLQIDTEEIKKIVHVQAQFFTRVKDLMRTAKEMIKIGFTEVDGKIVEYFFGPDCFVYKNDEDEYTKTNDYGSVAAAFRHMNPLKTENSPTFSDFINQEVESLLARIGKKCKNSTPYFGEVPASPESEV